MTRDRQMLTLYSVPNSLDCAKEMEWQEHTPANDPDGFAHASQFGNLPAITVGGFAFWATTKSCRTLPLFKSSKQTQGR